MEALPPASSTLTLPRRRIVHSSRSVIIVFVIIIPHETVDLSSSVASGIWWKDRVGLTIKIARM